MPSGIVDASRKAGAVLLVLSSVTLGIIGLGTTVDGGSLWGLGLIPVAAFGIIGATKLTPEGGSSGYCDRNL